MTQELHLMCGIPASGKSTFIKQEEQKLIADGYNVAVISRDEVRRSLLNESDKYFDKEKQVFEEFVRQVNESMEEGIDIVFVDATHINPPSRSKILRRLRPDSRVRLIIDVFDVPLDVALIRNAQRSGFARVPDSAIQDMYNNFRYPTHMELAKQGYYGFHNVKIINHKYEGGD